MTLEEIINLKIDKLDKENKELKNRIFQINSKIDEIESVRDKCETFVHDMADDWENISYFDMRLLTQYLVKYGNHSLDLKEVNDNFDIIKLVYEAISNGLDTKLDYKQIEFVRSYIGKHMKLIMDMEEGLEELESELKPIEEHNEKNKELRGELVTLLNKIKDENNTELLDEDEFLAFYSIIEDEDVKDKDKKEAIINFTKYNEEIGYAS